MGDMCKGSGNNPVEIIPGTPKDVAALRKKLITGLSTKVSQGATQYNHPLSTGTNPMQTQGASLISNLMGSGNYVPRTGSEMPHPEWGGGIDQREQDVDRNKTPIRRGGDGGGLTPTPPVIRKVKIGSLRPPGTNENPTLQMGAPQGMSPQGPPMGGAMGSQGIPQGINPQQMMMMAELAKRKQRFGI
jgi:hypothetical protein